MAAAAVALVVVLALVVWWFIGRLQDTVAIKVGEVKIYSRDYTAYLKAAQKANIEKDVAVQTLIDYHRTKEAVRVSKLPVSQDIADQHEAIYMQNNPKMPEIFATMQSYNAAVQQAIDLRDINGVDARLVRLPFRGKETEYDLPAKQEAFNLLESARKDLMQTKSDKGIEAIQKKYPGVSVVHKSIFTTEGALTGYDGRRINKLLTVEPRDVKAYLANCKEAVCGIKEVSQGETFFFMHIIARINRLAEDQVELFEEAKEQVKVVRYVD